jgi:hypothetical protein
VSRKTWAILYHFSLQTNRSLFKIAKREVDCGTAMLLLCACYVWRPTARHKTRISCVSQAAARITFPLEVHMEDKVMWKSQLSWKHITSFVYSELVKSQHCYYLVTSPQSLISNTENTRLRTPWSKVLGIKLWNQRENRRNTTANYLYSRSSATY